MDNAQAQPFVVRRAAVADAAALTRLREAMLSDMRMLTAGADPGWRDKADARVINLNATGDGIALYRSLGFTEPRYPVLQLRLAGPDASDPLGRRLRRLS
jgi:hypothetical protein